MNRRAVASHVSQLGRDTEDCALTTLKSTEDSLVLFTLFFWVFFLFFSKQQWTVLKRPRQLVTWAHQDIEYSDVSSTTGTFMKSMLDMRPVMCEENNSEKFHFRL